MVRPSFSPSLCGLAWGCLLVAGSMVSAGEPGVVRISKPAAAPVVRGQSSDIQLVGCKECEGGYGSAHSMGGFGYGHGGMTHGGFGHGDMSGWNGDCDTCNGGKGSAMIEYFKCKFGCLFPTGCGGAGCPPFGKYARVYPQDPNYFDQRDGQVYGAAGYGMPIAVPLAPVVGHQYNYSWGTPSSRLTPVSRIAPY
jgi:hypothetical protein